MLYRIIAMTCTLSIAAPAAASLNCTEDAMIVFDGSGSMAEMGFNDLREPRIFEARRAIEASVPEIARYRRLGLVIYGPGGMDECSGLDLRFGPIEDAAPRIIGDVEALEPAGDTALVDAVRMAAEVLDYRTEPGSIVLVTDGKETCGGSPCQLAAELAGHDLTVHVIGFKIRGDYFSWDTRGSNDYTEADSVARCLAERTGGRYVSTETTEELVEALYQTLGCSMMSDIPLRGKTRKVISIIN